MGMSVNKPRAGGRRHRPMGEINVTPFVDVMLVLLIVFMVTAPLLTVRTSNLQEMQHYQQEKTLPQREVIQLVLLRALR